MVKKTSIIILFLIITSFVFPNVRIIFEKNVPTFVDGINIKDYFENYFVEKLSEDLLLLVHVVSFEKEMAKERTVEFLQEKSGNYVYFEGTYYQVPDKTLYSYDSKNDKFYRDPQYGTYIYLPTYRWARKENDKYIRVFNFYKKNEKIEDVSYYSLGVYLTLIDVQKMTVLYSQFQYLTGNSLSQALGRLKKTYLSVLPKTYTFEEYEKLYNKKPSVALYYENIPLELSAAISQKFYNDGRYIVTDRTYLNDIVKLQYIKDLFDGEIVEFKFLPPKYVVNISGLNPYSEKITERTVVKFFTDKIDGQYYNDKKVEVGNYYTYDFQTKTYKIDKEKGTYVKVIRKSWEKEEYLYVGTSAPTFSDIFSENSKYLELYSSINAVVIETSTSKLIYGQNIGRSVESPIYETIDRFGSTRYNPKIYLKSRLFDRISTEVVSSISSTFLISSYITDVTDASTVKFADGKILGIKTGMKFKAMENGFTVAFLNTQKVSENTSQAKVFYILPGERLKEGLYIVESFSHPFKTGVGIDLSISSNSFEFIINYSPFNLNYVSTSSYGIGFGIGEEKNSLFFVALPLKIALSEIVVISPIIKVGFYNDINFSDDYIPYFAGGIRLSTNKREIFSSISTSIFSDLLILGDYGISIGLGFEF